MPYERRNEMTFSQIVDLVILVVTIIVKIIEAIWSRKSQWVLTRKGQDPPP